jgi:cytochrome c-type biogenesis protein CcmI
MITFAAILVALAALVYTLAVRSAGDAGAAAAPADPLRDKRETLYENLRDLQFEFRVGKLTEEDYRQAEAELQKELALLTPAKEAARSAAPPAPRAPAAPGGRACPHCGARFPQPVKCSGECGQPMGGGAA